MVKRGKKTKTGSKVIGNSKQDLLLENFVLLQKTLMETAVALKEVNAKINSILELFEEASRTFKTGKKPSTDIIGKLDSIEEQNQVIARSLLLLQKQLKEKERYGITKEGEELKPSIKRTKRKAKKKKRERAEPLFKEEFGADEGSEEESEEETEGEESEDEYRPKPLPEFSF